MISRHDLVWLTDAGWHAAIAQSGNAELERWRKHGWPAIGTRRPPDLGPDCVSVGIPLPPSADGSKGRVAITLERVHVAASSRPLPLPELVHWAPQAWRGSLQILTGTVRLRGYGSLAMQALTGLPYLRPASDIDVLFAPASQRELDAGLQALAACPLPLDGEIQFPGGASVAWREWLNATATGERVLVKAPDGVRLESAAVLMATLV